MYPQYTDTGLLTNNERTFVRESLQRLGFRNVITPVIQEGFIIAMNIVDNNRAFAGLLRSQQSSMTPDTIDSLVADYCNRNAHVLTDLYNRTAQQRQPQMGTYNAYPGQQPPPPMAGYQYGQRSPVGDLLSASHLPTPQAGPTMQAPQSMPSAAQIPAHGMLDDVLQYEPVITYDNTPADVASRLTNRLTRDSQCRLKLRSAHDMRFSKPTIITTMTLDEHVSGAADAISRVHQSLVRTSPEHEPFLHCIEYTTYKDIGISRDNLIALRKLAHDERLHHTHARNNTTENFNWMIRAWQDIVEVFGTLSRQDRDRLERGIFGIAASKNATFVRSLSDPERTLYPRSFEEMTASLKKIDETNPSASSTKFAQTYFYSVFELLSVFFISDNDELDNLIWLQSEHKVKSEKSHTGTEESVIHNKQPTAPPDSARATRAAAHADICESARLPINGVYWAETERVVLTNIPSTLRNTRCIKLPMPMGIEIMRKKIPQVLDALITAQTVLCHQQRIDAESTNYHYLLNIKKIAICAEDLRDGFAVYDICHSVICDETKTPVFLDYSTS